MEITLRKNIYDDLFWGLLSSWLLVDTINGFFLNINTPIPISQLFKLVVLVVVLVRLCYFYSGRVKVLLLILYVIILSIHLAIKGNDISSLIGTVGHLSKFLLAALLYCYVKRQILLYPLYVKSRIFRVFKINLIIFISNILLGVLGIGFTSYGEFGYKGFFYAGNELSGITIVLFPFFVNYMFVKYSYRSLIFLFVVLLLFITVGLMGTKSSLIAFVFSIVYIFMISDRRFITKAANKVFLFVLLIIIGGGGYFLVNKLGMLDRWLFFFNKGGLGMLFLSGREEYWMEEKAEFFNSGCATYLLGLGGMRTVEMDPFDALLNYGWVGIILVYSFYLYLLLTSYKRRNISRTTKVIFFTNMLILLSSSISGHLIFSGMVNIFIALLNALVFYPNGFSKEFKKLDIL